MTDGTGVRKRESLKNPVESPNGAGNGAADDQHTAASAALNRLPEMLKMSKGQEDSTIHYNCGRLPWQRQSIVLKLSVAEVPSSERSRQGGSQV